jgi:predicted Zn finger-like uncharacterized protein
MTVTCPECETRYVIPDARARGPFRVRCRRCGAAITSPGLASPETAGEQGPTPADQEAPPAPTPVLTAERHEASVLFSLASLTSLAAAPRTAAHDSGLIAIRALAAPTAVGEAEELAVPGFAPPPLLLPARCAGRSRWILPAALGAVAVLLVSTVALAAALLARAPAAPPTPIAGAPATPRVAPAPTAPTAPARAAPPAPSSASAPTEPPRGPAGTTAPTVAATPAPARAAAARPARIVRRLARPPARAALAAPAPAPEARAPRDPLAILVEKAIGRERPPDATPAPRVLPGVDLPTTLTKAELVAAMRKVQPAVQACHDRYRVAGLASVRLRIGGDGSVRSATVRGALAGTPTAACVEQAVRAARFPRFRDAHLTIPEYPFLLR